MVLYFSGTGNSQFAALQVAEEINDDNIVPINQYLKEGKKVSIQSERPLVFVAPVYGWRIPKVVERWILETNFQGSKDVYFILTCGSGCGNASAYAEKLCVEKGWQFQGLAPVRMPENYLALFPTPSEAECRTIMERAKPRITALAEQIRAGQRFSKPAVSFGGKLESATLNALFYELFVHDKRFRVSDGCISCGKCALRCPLNNISLVKGKPTWNGSCTHCMACIGGCPTEAIEYKSNSKGRHRHYIMEDSLCWNNGGETH